MYNNKNPLIFIHSYVIFIRRSYDSPDLHREALTCPLTIRGWF